MINIKTCGESIYFTKEKLPQKIVSERVIKSKLNLNVHCDNDLKGELCVGSFNIIIGMLGRG